MSDTPKAIMRARHLDPHNDDALDLLGFDFIEVQYGHHRLQVYPKRGRLVVTVVAGDPMSLHPIASNWLEIDL